MSPCCLSCSDGSVAVTGHLLCCTFLSWRLSLSRPPTGLCHVAPTFVQDSLHVTKKPTGWPLFNHCLCTTDQGAKSGRKVYTELKMRKDFASHGPTFRMVTSTFMPGPVQIWGWAPLRCSTLNGSWQGQGLVSQAPPKPSHCRSAELLWPRPQAVSPPCTTLPPASQAGAVLRSRGEHSWKPGGTALHLSSLECPLYNVDTQKVFGSYSGKK